MGDHADDLRDQEEFYMMVKFLHRNDRCGELVEYCPYCAYETERQLEVEEMFKPWIATGGSHNFSKGV